MLDTITKRKIDAARDILVGKVPVPSSQVEQITIALIYKFMYDMDNESIELGGNPKYFAGDFAPYAWNKLFDPKLSGEGRIMLYQDALAKIPNNASIPGLFRDIFKNAFLPYRDPETLKLFLKCIDEFTYDHSETLGDAFEYLLAVLGSQGDAGQFRTPRHIIEFMVELIDPQKEDSILDPACGTAGFLISAYKHILKTNSSNYDKHNDPHTFEAQNIPIEELVINGKKYSGDLLTPDQRAFTHKNIKGYDIAFEMVRLSLVNMYLHGFNTPQIYEYDTLTSTERWNEYANVILANPPFMTPKGGIRPHQRFSIQAKRSEVLFVDYMLEHLTTNGRAGIIVPEGIIFQSANAYKQLRKLLVEENYLVGVISLPGGVFNPYSGVKTSILWIDKALAKKTDKIIFIKVNSDGFDLGAQRRPIDANDLPVAFANAMAYKESILSQQDYAVPDKDVILVEKDKLAESGDFSLTADRYVEVKYNTTFNMVPVGTFYKKTMTIDPRKTPHDLFELWSIPAYDSGQPDVIKGQEIGSQKKLVEPDNILISRIVPHIRRCCVVTRNLSGLKQIASTEWIVLSSKDVLPHYIMSILLSDSFHEQFMRTITGVGGSLSRASINGVAEIKIPIPPLSVQKEIVAELDSYRRDINKAKEFIVESNQKIKDRIEKLWKS
ncbi:MAG: N-6 DNA methylase [Candidatus Cloacimonetes bacterium]|nr:N-6 DNA methylase [Candidatus Cloacimonadota bacterium]